MVDLARAFDIEIDPDATKNRLLPTLISAEQTGIFRRPPRYPEFLIRAARNSDMPIPIGGLPDTAPVARKIAAKTGVLPALKTWCKEAGINSFGMNKAQMLRALAEKSEEAVKETHDASGSFKAKSQIEPSESVPGENG